MKLPKESCLIDVIYRNHDERGEILSIVDNKIKNVSVITSNAGSIRSNHYHYADYHYMYVLKGEIDYFYKGLDDDEVKYLKVFEGQSVFTPPNEIHACYFAVETVMIVSSKNERDQATYESDTVRIELITHQNIRDMMSKYAK
jgi:quercetin dioxygenase-like cupin family protein